MKQNKYTDKYYFSKNEVKLQLDDKFSEDKWKNVINYRDMYSFELPVYFNFENKMRLIQTPWILQKEIKMMMKISNAQQEMLSELSKKYSSATLLNDISLKTNISDIIRVLESNGIVMTRSIVDSIINHTDEAESRNEKLTLKFSDEIENISSKLTPPREIAKRFFGIKELNAKEKYSVEILEQLHSSMMETIKFERINSLLTKTATILFTIINNEMFGTKSYEIAVLSCMSFLRNTFLTDILKGVSFFNTFDFYKQEIYKAIEMGREDEGDLTYLYFVLLVMFTKTIELSKEQIFNFIENEKRYNSLSLREKTGTVKTILRDYPDLSKRQAEFYVRHNTRGSNYTLADFQKYIGSSYETSRYSMEKLVNMGFYKKEKIGKNMYTSQSGREALINREKSHNALSLAFAILLSLFYIFILLVSSIELFIPIIVASSLFLIYTILKIFFQIHLIINFKKITKIIDTPKISYNISKSWTRKKHSTIWLGTLFAFINILLIVITLSLKYFIDSTTYLISSIVLTINFFLIIGSIYFNNQKLDNNLKLSKRFENFDSVEWKEINREQSSFYKSVCIYSIMTLLIFPLITLVIPPINKKLNMFIKK